MRRSFAILLGALAAGAAVFAGAFFISQQVCARRLAKATDDLDWLRYEFHLNDGELARVRQLHEGYLPQCHEMCARIAVKKGEVEAALTGATNVTATVERRVRELSELRAQCQLQMLRHFVEVSRAMPAEQGRRYLEEMRRLTLGAHEKVEESMSGATGQSHGHD
jgi:head-tail adaptor